MAAQPYRCLGYLEGKYWYYSFLLQKVISLSPVEHRKENLFNLAPLIYWQEHYPHGKQKGEAAWDKATDSLMQTCAAEGLFNPANIIGRGIWLIDGKGVTHYGDKVLIDGKRLSPREVTGKKVFEIAESLQIGQSDPKADFTQIQSFLEQLSFQTPNAPLLIAGWVVCAMAAGALHWRPHGWVTGKSGRGKSAVIMVLKRLLGNCGEYYTGETTEAGIRQDLKHDCRAIVFDEAEPKTAIAQIKIQNVLNLFRQASSDETAKIAKGTVSGKGINYRVRSCAFMGSVNPYLTEEPDKNRFFIIEMGEPIEKEDFDKWKFAMENCFNEGFQAALHSRISENIVTLAANAKTFSHVLAARFTNNRAGDQYGTLMAGAYLLTSTKLVNKNEAADWCSDMVFPSDDKNRDEKSDEQDLWNYMLERKIPIGRDDGNKIINMNRPLAELIDVAFGTNFSVNYTQTHAELALSDIGIKAVVEDGKRYVAVSTNHSALADLISRSRFFGLEWSPILRRLQNSATTKKVYRIGIGRKPCSVTLILWEDEFVSVKKKLTQKLTE